ncbi:MAG: DUF1684 domain-containing protein [Bacteroidetes bacterium]|nr:DUF1684 domain-containing protein [Fibrella sp.]
MRWLLPLGAIWGLITLAQAQPVTYEQQIVAHRAAYKAEFRASPNSPLHSESDLGMLRFYAPDIRYRVEATVQRTPEAEPFEMPTYSGKTQSHVKYAVLTFSLNSQSLTLDLFRNLTLGRLPQYRDYLFLPFKDATTGTATYGGGRYLDLRLGEIRDGKLMLDFNKAYNPYCAYADGYSCPIPPKANELPVPVEAGEKKWGKVH